MPRRESRRTGVCAGLLLLGGLVHAQPGQPAPNGRLVVHVAHGAVTVQADDVSVRDILEEVALRGDLVIDLEGSMDDRLRIAFDALPLSTALGRILHDQNFVFRTSSGTAGAMPARLWVFSSRTERDHASPLHRPAGATAFATEEKLARLGLALQDENATVREEAVLRLRDIDDGAVVTMLQQALTDPDLRVRQAAVEVAGEIARDDAARALAFALDDEDAALREEVVYALGDLGGDVVVGILQEALADERRTVREAAAEVLADLTALP